MPEFLVTYRDNNTGHLFNVHICNVDDDQQAIAIANNSIQDDVDPEYMFTRSVENTFPDSDYIPF